MQPTPAQHSAGPDRILLVRHAQSEWNAAHRWQGQADPPLSAVGEHQASRLADHPRLARIDAIVTSDLIRAVETAERIAQRKDLPLSIDSVLRELDVGSWSGRTRAQIEQAQPGALARYAAGIAGWEGGESCAAHAQRCRAAARMLESWSGASSLCAITHGGTARMIVVALLGLADADRARLAGAAHASVTELRRAAHGWQLVAYGDG